MNETRKEIIGLIEPFMEKDILKGCILEMVDGRIEYVDGYFDCYGPGDYIDDKYLLKTDVLEGFKSNDIVEKIIGHYDITAVLKYMKNAPINILLEEMEIEYNDYGEDNIYIPIKPLHLYSEKEEKDLLELLKKLK